MTKENQRKEIQNAVTAHRADLNEAYRRALRQTLFTNRAQVRPTRLTHIAQTELETLEAFLANPEDQPLATQRGDALCELGLGEEAVLQLGQAARQFCLTRLPKTLQLSALQLVEKYYQSLLSSFVATREKIILAEQDRVRNALERTLNRYTTQAQLTADIGRIAGATLDLNELLASAVTFIYERLGFYFVGVFLVSEPLDRLILRAGVGEPQADLPAQGYSLEIDDSSLPGRCVLQKERQLIRDKVLGTAGITVDVLPHTQSQLALPLIARGSVIGVIAVYNKEPSVSVEEDIVALSVIADQLAHAIDNARLYTEAQARLHELQTAHRSYLRKAWQKFSDITTAFQYNQITDAFTPAENIWRPEMLEAVRAGKPITTPHSAKPSLAVPISLRGQVLGVIDLYDETAPREWSEDDVELVANVATQTALSLDNARLFIEAQDALAEVAEQVRRPALLNEMNQELNQINDEADIYYVAARHIHNILQADLVEIALLNDAGDALEPVAFWGDGNLQLLEAKIFVAQTAAGSVVTQSKQTLTPGEQQSQWLNAIIIPDTAVSHWRDVQQAARLGINAMMIAPLVIGTDVIGVLTVGSKTTNQYTTEDENFFIQITALLSSTIDNRRLFQRIHHALATTETLYNISQGLNMAGSLEDILAVVMNGFPLPDINRALLMAIERDPATQTEAIIVIANWHSSKGPAPIPVGRRYPQTSGNIMQTLLSHHPHFVADVQTDTHLDAATRAWAEQHHTQSLAILPLSVGQRHLGALVLQGEAPHVFTEKEQQPYLSVVSQIATAVENQRLLAETQSALEEVEAAQRRYTVQAWDAYYSTSQTLKYEQVRDAETAVPAELPAAVIEAVRQKQTIVHGSANSADDPTADGAAPANLVVPLILRDEVTGVLGLQETESSRVWLPEEIALVEAIANEFAQVSEELRLLDNAQKRAAREARINEIGEKIQSAQSLEEALRIAVKEVGLSLKAPQTTVQLAIEAEEQQ